MDPEGGFKPQSVDLPPSESSSLTTMQQTATDPTQTSSLPRLPTGISITPATLEAKPTFAHPSIKPLGSGTQMPPPSSIGGQSRSQGQQNLEAIRKNTITKTLRNCDIEEEVLLVCHQSMSKIIIEAEKI